MGAVPGAQHTLPVPVLLLVLLLAPAAGRASSGGGPAWRRGEPGLPRGGRASGTSSALWPRIGPGFIFNAASSIGSSPSSRKTRGFMITFAFQLGGPGPAVAPAPESAPWAPRPAAGDALQPLFFYPTAAGFTPFFAFFRSRWWPWAGSRGAAGEIRAGERSEAPGRPGDTRGR